MIDIKAKNFPEQQKSINSQIKVQTQCKTEYKWIYNSIHHSVLECIKDKVKIPYHSEDFNIKTEDFITSITVWYRLYADKKFNVDLKIFQRK